MCSFSGGRERVGIVLRCSLGVPAAGQTPADAGAERLLDDPGDGSRATAAFGAATETAIDLLGIPGKLVRIVDGMADVMVAQDVTGTDNHEKRQSFRDTSRSIVKSVARCKRKSRVLKGFQIAAKLYYSSKIASLRQIKRREIHSVASAALASTTFRRNVG